MGLDDLKRGLLDAADVLRHTTGKGLLRAAKGAQREVLNDVGDAGEGEATEVAQRLRSLGRKLEAEALDDRGRVDYARVRQSEHRALFEATARELAGVDPTALQGDAARIAFWLNVYNVLAIHGVVALGIERSVMEDPTFFSRAAYRVGVQSFTLDEIENGVLRRNRTHPVSKEPLWALDDARLANCPQKVDPRIHAALVCASESCPAVRFYDAEQLEAQLEAASHAYVNGEVVVDHRRRAVVLPITFRYYIEDFEAGSIAFCLKYAEEELAEDLRKAATYRMDYARYDWSLNAT